MRRGKVFREFPKHTVHRHQIVGGCFRTDVADTRPFCVPAMSSVIAVASFGQAIKSPAFFIVAHSQQDRFMIPSGCPQRVGSRLSVSVNSSGAGYFNELIPADGFPFFSIPFRQNSGLSIELSHCGLAVFSVVGVDHHSLPGIQTFAMSSRQ